MQVARGRLVTCLLVYKHQYASCSRPQLSIQKDEIFCSFRPSGDNEACGCYSSATNTRATEYAVRDARSTEEQGLSSIVMAGYRLGPRRTTSISPERPSLFSAVSHHGSPTTPASSSSHGPLSFSALQRTFSQLQSKAQPKLDRARYKAEAGLTRRGFVKDDGGGPILRDVDLEGEDGYAVDYTRKGRDGEVEGWRPKERSMSPAWSSGKTRR